MRRTQEILIQNLSESLDLQNQKLFCEPARTSRSNHSIFTRVESIRKILEVSRTISEKFPSPICPDKDTAFKTPVYWLDGGDDVRILTLAQDGLHIAAAWLDKELGVLTHCGKFSKMNFLHAEKLSRVGYNYFDCANAYAKTLLNAGFYLVMAQDESETSYPTFKVTLPSENTELHNMSFVLSCPKNNSENKVPTRVRFKKQYDDLQVVIYNPTGTNEDYFVKDGAEFMRMKLINAILDQSIINK